MIIKYKIEFQKKKPECTVLKNKLIKSFPSSKI